MASPIITEFSVDSGIQGDRLTNDRSITLIGSADPNVTMRLFADGVLLATITSDENGAWSFTTLELADNRYSFTAETGEGGDLQASDPFEITIDGVTAAPEITSVNPAESGLQLIGTAEAGASVDIYRDGTLLGIVTATASGLWEYLDTSYVDGSVSYSARATDAAGNTAQTAADVAYSPPNETPVLDLDGSADGTGYDLTFTAGGAAVAIADTDAVIRDGDDTHMSGATVTLTNPQAGDELIVNTADLPAGIAIDPASISTTIIVTGSATRADYEAALRQVLFNNASKDPSAETRTIEVAVNDGAASSNIAVTSIAVDSAPATTLTTSSTPIIFETRVAAAGDDVEERASGAISGNVSDLDLGYDGSRAQTVGLRFTGIDIPPGAVITGAYIQFQTDEMNTGAASLSIRGEDADDAAAFTTAKFDASSRLATDASVAWQPADWTIRGEVGLAQRTPDLATIIQEIVDRAGWAALNDMVFLVTGTGTRTAESFEGSAAGAPLLHIEYYVPLPSDPVVFNTPADTNAAANQIAELAAAGTQVGISASASDPNAGETVTYSLNDPRFAIDPNTGVITRSGTGIIDFETETSITLTVTATSSDQSSATRTFTLGILNSPEPVAFNTPADTDPVANQIAELAAAGTQVGITASAKDPDAGDTATYSLNDPRFAIDPNTGVITRSGTGIIDFETETSITLTVTATSSDQSSATRTFTLGLLNSPEPVAFKTPADTDPVANQIAELAAAGTAVGITASAKDPDAGDTVTYSLNDPRFAIDPNTGVITRSGTGIIDFETETSITLTVTATSSDQSSATQTFTLGILDSPEPVAFNTPADTDPVANQIAELAAGGTAVGITASAKDPDAGDTVAYNLNDPRFAIDANGVITRSGTSTLDAQSQPSITLTVTATSSDGSSDTESFNVSVTTSTNNQLPTSVTLVHTIQTSQWSPASPDPSGIAYISHLGTLLISDGEVDEMSIFTGKNLFEMSLSGELVRPLTTISFSDEPAGVAYNPTNHHLYFADDTGTKSIYELNPGADGLYNTSDDIVTSFKTSAFGSSDPEGLAYDTKREVLYLANGVNDTIYTIDPGANGKFDGVPSVGGDDVMTSFSAAPLGVNDPEGVEYDPVHDLLYIIASRKSVVMATPTGELLGTLDISAAGARKPAGLALAPSSEDPSQMSLYIVDRAVDNGSNPNENDGKVYEFMFDNWLLA